MFTDTNETDRLDRTRQNLWRGAIGSALLVLLLLGTACKVPEGNSDERSGPAGAGYADQTLLAQQARINSSRAQAAATAAVPGTVRGVRLDRMDTGIVYYVFVQPKDGGLTRVNVDANNGTVLGKAPATLDEVGSEEGGD